MAPGASVISPSPHGHSPAIARTSVLLPVPDSPATSTFSPNCTVTSASSTTTVPSESATDTSLQPDRGAVAFGAADRAGLALLDAIQPVERDQQVRGAPRRRGPFGEPRIVVDDPVERVLHLDEGGGRLHHGAERHLAGEIFRRAQDHRDHRRDDEIAVRHEHRAHVLAAPSCAQVMITLASSLSSPARSSFSPPRIAMLSPYSRTRVERRAELGLGLVLRLGGRHEAARDHQSSAR